MNIKKLVEFFNNLKEEDIVDFGEDYEGNPHFVILNLCKNPSLLTVGNFDNADLVDSNC